MGAPTTLPPLLGSRAPRIAGAAVAVAVGLSAFVPQLGALSYEGALLVGIVLPTVVLLLSSSELASVEAPPLEHVARGMALGLWLFTVALGADLAHGLVRGFCDFWGGLENWVLGPGVGAVLAGAWGSVIAEVCRWVRPAAWKRGCRIGLAIAVPLGCVSVSVGRFYGSPMVHAYDPFVGFFSGTLYDTIVELGGLRTYRLGTAATLGALVVGAAVAGRRPRGTLCLRRPARPDLIALGLWLSAASVVHSASGPRLGHWHTSTTIAEALGGRTVGHRCELVHGRGHAREVIERLALECEGHVAEVEHWLGARGPERIRVFVFDSARQKQAFMGAAHTNIAKPWRGEVYIQGTSYPHRVLGHELAHVIASAVSRGPFAVAGSFGGILPDPGLIEGLAVAASPRDEDLDPEEWAKAMKDLGVLPPLRRLFALGFLAESSSTAYTASGAFVTWVRSSFGAEAVRRWYGGADLEEVTGATLEALEARWHTRLDQLVLPPSARVIAEARFDRPGFFARRCPRAVDACRERADRLEDRGDVGGALAELDRAASLDPSDPRLRVERAKLAVRLGTPDAEAALDELAGDGSIPRSLRDRALEEVADRALARGETRMAVESYEQLVPRTLDEGRLRTLHVKLAAARDAALRPAIVSLLLDDSRDDRRRAKAYAALGQLRAARPDDGLAAYLLARAMYDAGDFRAAVESLGWALARRIDVPRVRVEALRLAVLAACSSGDVTTAKRYLAQFLEHPDARPARRAYLTRAVERCEHAHVATAADGSGSG